MTARLPKMFRAVVVEVSASTRAVIHRPTGDVMIVKGREVTYLSAPEVEKIMAGRSAFLASRSQTP